MENKNCLVCGTADGQPFSKEQATTSLQKLNGWNLSADNKKISKEFKFKNFTQALNFINQIAPIAEAQNHHPDIEFGWGYCKINLQTHKINGLSDADFNLAKSIDSLTINN
jgi:4a-hydroxytetrahydrobiopterin dehydratase